METLYIKLVAPGRKAYVPKIAGKHFKARMGYKRASEAQAHSLLVRERYRRLKAAEQKA